MSTQKGLSHFTDSCEFLRTLVTSRELVPRLWCGLERASQKKIAAHRKSNFPILYFDRAIWKIASWVDSSQVIMKLMIFYVCTARFLLSQKWTKICWRIGPWASLNKILYCIQAKYIFYMTEQFEKAGGLCQNMFAGFAYISTYYYPGLKIMSIHWSHQT